MGRLIPAGTGMGRAYVAAAERGRSGGSKADSSGDDFYVRDLPRALGKSPVDARFDSMQSQVWQTVQTEALMATLTGSFGILAGTIAALGLYGVMSYLVSRGAALAVAAGKTASALLYGLTAADPATMAQAVAVLLMVAALATYVPAARAARIDRMRALREE